MFDTHMHTEYSTDSNMKIHEVIDKSKEYNIGAIITEHMDLNYKDKDKFRLDCDKYFNDYIRYRNDRLLLGIEIGMSNEYSDQYRQIINNYPFDYVIGSLHEMNNEDLYMADTLYKDYSKDELYIKYFKEIISRVDKHEFIDSLGHIDYLSRCAKYDDREMYYDVYKEYIDEVLKKLIDKGICLELNTRRLCDKSAIDNLLKIYSRFYELGGKYITIGSDAHIKDNIGKYFKTAIDMVEYCNLRPVYFKNRKLEIL